MTIFDRNDPRNHGLIAYARACHKEAVSQLGESDAGTYEDFKRDHQSELPRALDEDDSPGEFYTRVVK